jgi:hypothetical protein
MTWRSSEGNIRRLIGAQFRGLSGGTDVKQDKLTGDRDMKLTSHLHRVLKLRMLGAIPSLLHTPPLIEHNENYIVTTSAVPESVMFLPGRQRILGPFPYSR